MTPDTVVTLTTGQKIVVLESAEEVVERVIQFRRSIIAGSPTCPLRRLESDEDRMARERRKEDKERLREAYRDKGYFTAKVLDQDVKIRKKDAGKFRIPLFYPNKASILADLTVPVEEGRQYHLSKITFTGVKLVVTPF